MNSLASSGTVEDKPFYITDRFPESPYFGRHYTCWDRNNDEKSAYSEDSGATWTEVDLPAPAQGAYDIGCDLAVTDGGVVHVVWNRLTCPDLFGPCTEGRMFHTRSTDGGVTWSAPVLVNDFVLVDFGANNCASAQNERCLNAFGSLDVDNSGGPCRGTLYVAYSDIPTGTEVDPDKTNVYARTSADGGATWSTAVQVNSDDRFSLNANFHPWLQVDRGTRHAVAAWHDTRNWSNHKRVDYFVGRSNDCGASWTDEQVSASSAEFNNSTITYSTEHSSENANVNPNQFGEYLGLDVAGGRAFAAWTDTRHFEPEITETQLENLGFVEVRFAEIFVDGFETGDARVWSDEIEE